jgi:hypothetical protein
MFYRGSRYEPVPDAEITEISEIGAAGGRTIRYKRVRFIPETRGTFGHRVAEGERLDLIAYQSYKNPEQFWRICDANLALLPEELVEEIGRVLLIPVPMA